MPNRQSSKEDLLSAPPISGSFEEIKQEKEHSPFSKANNVSSGIDSHEFAANLKAEKITPVVYTKINNKQGTSDPSRSIVVKTGSGSFLTRLPTFHASALGPWHGVIAYDACVRLCLNAWAKGCMEAPVFLENDCALLRSTFGLQQVLLQSEEELLVTRSSEVGCKGAAPKPKEMVGKMKV